MVIFTAFALPINEILSGISGDVYGRWIHETNLFLNPNFFNTKKTHWFHPIEFIIKNVPHLNESILFIWCYVCEYPLQRRSQQLYHYFNIYI